LLRPPSPVCGGATVATTAVGVRVAVEGTLVDGTEVDGTEVDVAWVVLVVVGVEVTGVEVDVLVATVEVLVGGVPVAVGDWPWTSLPPGITNAATARTAPADKAPIVARSLKSILIGLPLE
jgi:hypothetical protein